MVNLLAGNEGYLSLAWVKSRTILSGYCACVKVAFAASVIKLHDCYVSPDADRSP
jgi:hypothetical protein